MSYDIETMPSVDDRTLPWELPGVVDVRKAKTVTEVVKMANLDWTVSQEPAYQRLPGDRKFRPVPNRVLNIRDDTRDVLGVVTPKYHPAQNEDAFAFAQELVEGDLHFHQAAQLEGGKLVLIVLELGTNIEVPDDGPVRPYLLIMNAHDGYRPYSASLQVVRYTCVNQLSASLRNATAAWKLKHTGTLLGRVAVARETLGISFRYLDEFEKLAQRFARTRVNNATADDLFRTIFPISAAATESQVERSQYHGALQVWQQSETLGPSRNTVWGVLNAVTEFVDHASKYRSGMLTWEEARAESLMFGPASWKKQAAFNVLTAFVEEQG